MQPLSVRAIELLQKLETAVRDHEVKRLSGDFSSISEEVMGVVAARKAINAYIHELENALTTANMEEKKTTPDHELTPINKDFNGYLSAHELGRQLLAGPDHLMVMVVPVFDMPGEAHALPIQTQRAIVDSRECIVPAPIPEPEPVHPGWPGQRGGMAMDGQCPL